MAKKTTKTNGAFINHYPAGMVHIRKTTDKNGNEREFASVSIACPESKTGMANITVNMGQLLPATKKDGTVVDGRYSILLGDADKERTVSVATNNPKNAKNRKYADVKLTNAQIAEYVNTARAAYAEEQEAQA